MDYSTLKHPTNQIEAVYAGDVDALVFLVKLSGGFWWGYLFDDGTVHWWLPVSNRSYKTYEEMVKNGWEEYMSAEPLWTAQEKPEQNQQSAAVVKPEPQNPPYYPFKSEQHKRAYYGFKE